MIRKFTFGVFAAAFALLASCNKAEVKDGELVVLNYEVAMPGVATKAETIGDGSHVNEVVCAVFENGTEISALRKTFPRNPDGSFPNYQPALYLGREYQIVFWAHKSGKYDVAKMDDITYGTAGYATNDENMDAFTLTQKVKVNNDRSITVGTGENAVTYQNTQTASAILKRPFVKLNIGSVASDWTNAGVDITHSRITLNVMQTHFNAVNGEVVAEKTLTDVSYSGELVGQTFKVKITDENEVEQEVEYKYVSLNYLFPGAVASITIEVATKDFGAADFNPETDIVSVVTKENVPISNGNNKLNLIGNVLKGQLNFNVEMDPSFDGTTNEDL